MPLEIDANCLARLSALLAGSLRDITVDNNMFLAQPYANVVTEADRKTLPLHAPLREQLHAYISDTPFKDFIFDTLSRELYEEQKYDQSRTKVKLPEVPGYADVEKTANRLIESFCSLPWEYVISLPLPIQIGGTLCAFQNYQISSDMSLAVPNDAFASLYPLASGIEARDRKISRELRDESAGSPVASFARASLADSGVDPLKWDSESAHLQIFVKGFIGFYGDLAPTDDAIDYVKTFVGLGVAIGLFRVNRSFSRPSPKTHLLVHRRVDSGHWVVQRTLELDALVSEVLHDLALNEPDGGFRSKTEQLAHISLLLRRIRYMFFAGQRARRIALAAQWLFDSYCGLNELLWFVQAAVVMEILLGDKAVSDLMGLGELLRNRCAYLISGSSEDREAILRDFAAIYKVRSSIVHAGKKRLTSEEGILFEKLRWMCQQVISREMDLLGPPEPPLGPSPLPPLTELR